MVDGRPPPRSRQGRAVLEAVLHLDHPTAEEVWSHVHRTDAGVSLATVYRNLDRFVKEGRIAARGIGERRRYDGNLAPHIHLHDDATDRLVDIPIPPPLAAELHALARTYFAGAATSTIELKGTLRTPTETDP